MADESKPDGVDGSEETTEEVTTPANDAPADTSAETPQEPPKPQQADEAVANQAPKESWFKKLGHMHYALAIAVVIILVLLGVILFGSSDSETEESNTDDTSQADDEDLLSDDEIHSEAGTDDVETVDNGSAIVNGQVTWEQTPVLVADQSLFVKGAITSFYAEKEVEYGYDIYGTAPETAIETYRLGETSSETIFLNQVLLGVGLGDFDATFFSVVDKSTGEVTVLRWHSKNLFDELTDELSIPTLKDEVVLSDTGTIPELDYEDSITYEGVTVERVSGWFAPFGSFTDDGITRLADSDTETFEQVIEATTVDRSTLYEVIRDIDYADGVKTYQLLLELPNGFRVQYRYITDLMRDDNSIEVTWSNDSATTQDVYRWDLIWAGCGAVNQPLVLDKQYHKDLDVVGSSNGQDIFWLNNKDHPTVKALYEASSQGALESITQEEFFNDRPAVVVRNDLGYYLILNNEKYQRAAECAKPVIYLYPEVPTVVSVSVGADVTKSYPRYDDGWSVLAFPNGQLFNAGGFYDSLFWDGYGHGEYPDITSGRFVVRADVEPTLTQQMQYMGLNDKEIADFLEYWMPLMPDSNFVRLTWFNTQEMNQLAPLELSFTPDSVIRVFLDFEGVDRPYDLPLQQLPRYERDGFTLVEWGGLRIAQ